MAITAKPYWRGFYFVGCCNCRQISPRYFAIERSGIAKKQNGVSHRLKKRWDIAAYFFKCFLNYINLKKYAAMAAVFVLLLSRFGLSSKTLRVIKKKPRWAKTKEALLTNA